MKDSSAHPRQTADLKRRLAQRRAIETSHHKGRKAHGHGDYLLRHDRLLAPVLRFALRTTGLYSRGVRNALSPAVRTVRYRFGELPRSLEGFRLLLLADLHIDGLDGLAEVIAERVSELSVDLCVMTGDYRFEVDGPCNLVYPRMRTVLSGIHARHGVFAILGNHDAAEIALELESMGVRMLINEAVELRQGDGRLWLIGVEDPHYYGCDDLAGALRTVAPGGFKILLAHSPELFEEASGAGVHLYLCGHTHAGQICLPWIGPALLNADCPRDYARGVWRHGNMKGYTSAGVGTSMLPVRYNCPPEIILVELTGNAVR